MKLFFQNIFLFQNVKKFYFSTKLLEGQGQVLGLERDRNLLCNVRNHNKREARFKTHGKMLQQSNHVF